MSYAGHIRPCEAGAEAQAVEAVAHVQATEVEVDGGLAGAEHVSLSAT